MPPIIRHFRQGDSDHESYHPTASLLGPSSLDAYSCQKQTNNTYELESTDLEGGYDNSLPVKYGGRLSSESQLDLNSEDGFLYHTAPRPTRWTGFRTAIRHLGICRRSRTTKGPCGDGSFENSSPCVRRACRRASTLRWLLRSMLTIFIMLGVFQLFTLILGAVVAFFPDDLDYDLHRLGSARHRAEELARWPNILTHNIPPVACHSHNDYWRKVPLLSAVTAGCTSVEADIWHYDGDEELYVGHSTSSLAPERTLRNLYIDPLLALLEKQNPITRFHPEVENPPNGIFDSDPSQGLVLLVDFKTSGAKTWPHLLSQLSPLRDRGYLTYYNGTGIVQRPITVVGTGNAPFDLLTANTTYREVFFDAPLDKMAEIGGLAVADTTTAAHDFNVNLRQSPAMPPPLGPREASDDSDKGQGKSGTSGVSPTIYDQTNSYYASVSFTRSIGLLWRMRLSSSQIRLIRAQIEGAHRQGLKVRYWGTPSWPRVLRNHVWEFLMSEGADVLNVDDLRSATRAKWRRRGWWHWLA